MRIWSRTMRNRPWNNSPVFALALALSALAAPPSLSGQGQAFAGFDAFMAQVMDDWRIPGVAVGVIHDGEIVLAQGFGYRDIENELPVTGNTTMAIGSNSKSFTVTLMAMLVDEGKLDWDTPVRDYLADFRLYDEFATAEMTPRDLVSHQSGLPRHDNVWYGRAASREEIFHKLRYLEPNASFRSRYQYQNLMFMTAGYLTERLTGRDWDGLVDEHIFTPLGMDRSNTSVDDSPGSGDHALPYMLRDGVLKRVPLRNIDNAGPAGSINSNVVEMMAYIEAHMDGGIQDGHRLISEESSAEMQQPQFAMEGDSEFAEVGPTSYGLGLRVTTYRGHKMVLHGGGIDGFISSMSWLPREKMGVMVLTNRSGDMNPVPLMVAYNVYDRLLGLPEVDWNARNLEERQEQEARAAESEREMTGRRVEGTRPSHSLDAYAGTYHHPGYGTMQVAADGNGLRVSYDGIALDMEHFHYEVFRITSPPATVPVTGLVTFNTDSDGRVSSVAIPFEPNGADIVFKRVES
ncbi:MAG: serine hydrolase [Gemmatimonadetes bacterium]|nr:serine hydrolase [Gemmatimonadota bacterium]MYC92707.1 serine hydrolase [Gemmatimonadota bacterium]MYJ17749.1 serine hydrolase [Gemmatimonadota bacterium]